MTNNEATIITAKKEFFPSFCSVQQTTCNFQTSNTGYYSDQREMKFKQVITVTLSVILCRTKVYGRAATPIRVKLSEDGCLRLLRFHLWYANCHYVRRMDLCIHIFTQLYKGTRYKHHETCLFIYCLVLCIVFWDGQINYNRPFCSVSLMVSVGVTWQSQSEVEW